jgi:peptidoglycan hydrolase-like amidase
MKTLNPFKNLGLGLVFMTILGFSFTTFAATFTTDTESPFKQTKNYFTGVILEYQQTSSVDDHVEIQLRFKDGLLNTEWVTVEANQDFKNKPGLQDGLINTNLTNKYQYRIHIEAGPDKIKPKIENLKFTFINPKAGTSEELIQNEQDGVQNLVAASTKATKKVKVISRKAWGAKDSYNYITSETASLSDSGDAEKSETANDDPDIEKVVSKENGYDLLWPYEYMKKVRMIVVHHTASTSDLDNPEQAIRNIQYYHAVKRGWGDIGYNYIIDQDGNIYEGRKGGEKVVGGHSLPVNQTSIGITVLGNFETQKVPKAVATAITNLATEKANLYGLNVKKSVTYGEKSYPVFGGHKDNSKTACPGKNLYDALPNIKNLIAKGGLKSSSVTVDKKNLSTEDFAFEDLNPLREDTELNAGETKKIQIKLKNIGKKTWDKNTTYLAFYDSSEYQNALKFKTSATNSALVGFLKETTVNPGKTGTFELEITGGLQAGMQNLYLRAVLNSVVKSNSPISVPIYINEGEFRFSVSGKKSVSLELKPNETKNVEFTIKNTSNFTWNKTNTTLLGIINPQDSISQILEGNPNARISTIGNTELKKGASQKITLKVKAPATPGFYVESYAPVIDAVSWFEKDTPFTINLRVKGDIKASGTSTKKTTAKTSTTTVRSESKTTKIAATDSELGPEIRIHISNFNQDKAEVTTTEESNIILDGVNIGTLGKSKKIIIEKSTNGNLSVAFASTSKVGKILEIQTSAENINTISNFENRPSWNKNLNDNQFRGKLEFQNIGSKLYAINVLPLEYYIRGLAEISNGDNTEKIKTIIVAGRSYAYFYLTEGKGKKFKGMPFDLDDSPDRTQKYLGYGYELRSPNVTKAIKETAGEVLLYNKKSVVIPYFNQSDGKTRSAKEVWGWSDAPYLVSVTDKYCKTATKLLGHGVGISGCGATGMAEAGFTHKEILEYYLKGIELKKVYE